MKKVLLLLTLLVPLLFFLFRTSYGQSKSKDLGTIISKHHESSQKALGEDQGQQVFIPVVIHVVYQTPDQNISTEQIISQLSVLNEDFNRLNADTINTLSVFKTIAGNAKIIFQLALKDETDNPSDGITRTPSLHGPFFNDDIHYTALGGKNAWNTSRFLNIWVCDLPEGTFGFGTPPGTDGERDGVVIDFRYFGTMGTAVQSYSKGRTTTHEIGHWLGLKHLWGTVGGCVDDDGVEDTPLQSGPSSGCNLSRVSCNALNMVQNFMDQSSDDCMNFFTKGQVLEMRRNLFAHRAEAIQEGIVTSVSETRPVMELIKTANGLYKLNSSEVIVNAKAFDLLGREIVVDSDAYGESTEIFLNFNSQKGPFILIVGTRRNKHSFRIIN